MHGNNRRFSNIKGSILLNLHGTFTFKYSLSFSIDAVEGHRLEF